MNRIGIAVLASAVVLAGPAVAADLPVKAPTPAQVVAAYNWSGFYTASSVGAGWRDIRGDYVLPPPDRHNTSSTRVWTASAVGYQAMLGRWVVGIEGSYSSPFEKSFDSSPDGSDCEASPIPPTSVCYARIKFLWTVGGRLGHTFGNWMVYASGGYASGRIDSFIGDSAVPAGRTPEVRKWHGGWYAGAGVDVYVTRVMWSDLIVGIEYKHIDLGTERHINPTGPINDIDFRATVDLVMARATFKWVGAGPFEMLRR